MKKVFKYFLGVLVMLLFFILIDDSGVGFMGYLKKIKDWANK
jgi:hypothetical protein